MFTELLTSHSWISRVFPGVGRFNFEEVLFTKISKNSELLLRLAKEMKSAEPQLTEDFKRRSEEFGAHAFSIDRSDYNAWIDDSGRIYLTMAHPFLSW